MSLSFHSKRIGKPPEKLLAVIYLLCIGLLTALAAGAFRMNKAILRIPAILLLGVLIFVLCVRWMRSQKR